MYPRTKQLDAMHEKSRANRDRNDVWAGEAIIVGIVLVAIGFAAVVAKILS